MKIGFFIVAAVSVMLQASAFTVGPQTRIVVPDPDATGIARAIGEAAHELADNIAEATGLRIAVVPASKSADLKNAIAVGREFAERAGLMPLDLKDFDNLIVEKDGVVYLFGRDRPGRKSEKPLGWSNLILPSVKAVCSFEERFMGVRYLAPGAVGCEVPKRSAVEIPDGTFLRTNPPMNAGNGRFFTMMYCLANNIFGHGSYKTYGGHLYPDALPVDKYFKDHPEYYALIGSDREQSQKGNPVLCISHPDVKRLIVEKIVADFDGGVETVELGQNDGWEFCECEKCKAYGGAGAEDPGEKFWIFHNEIAKEVYKLRPEKTVQIISYARTSEPPRTFRKFAPNVMVEMMKTSPRAFERWKEYEVPRGFTCYIYLWGEFPQPGLTCKTSVPYAAECARRFVSGGVKSVYRCGYGELFGTEGPSYYVFNRLLGDPSLNEKALVEEYHQAAFGPAARPMKSFHETLDAHVRGFNKTIEGFPDPNGNVYPIQSWLDTPDATIGYIWTPAVMKSLEGYLTQAEKTEGLADRQRKRLELVRRELEYACHLGRICGLYNAFRLQLDKASFRPLAEAVLARNAFLDSLYDEKGRMRHIEGWPEVNVLGGFERSMMQHNGRLSATLDAPFTWDVKMMLDRGIVPGGPVKETTVMRLAAKPALGEYDTGAFAAAKPQRLGGMQLNRLDYATSFKLGYDRENLYLAVEAELPDDQAFDAMGHDGVCFRQECLELYVDPTFAHAKNYHFIWNPVANSCLEEAFGLVKDPLDPRFDTMNIDWNGKWTYEVKRANGRWLSLVTIPFSTFGVSAPEKGEKWYLNLGRETYRPNDLQLATWNPSLEGRGMRDRESMGIIRFE